MENKDGEDEEKTLIYCNDVSELVLRLLEDQGLEQNKTDAKLSLDKGRGSVKVTHSLMEKEERVKTGQQTRDGQRWNRRIRSLELWHP